MNRISLYILLILIFLGGSAFFYSNPTNAPYLLNGAALPYFFNQQKTESNSGAMTAILVDQFKTGLLVKTYYQKYRLVYPFKLPEYKVFRTSSKFWKSNQQNLGMSLYSRDDKENSEQLVPLPPGSIFLNNSAYGNWVMENSGTKVWQFHHVYQHFYKHLGWGEFRPSFEFYKELMIHLENNQAYYGPSAIFGTSGEVTKVGILKDRILKSKEKFNLKEHIKKFLRISTTQKDISNE